MRERKLKINLEGLWDNSNQSFTVRYKDINLTSQHLLAKRIKETAIQSSIRKENGPNIPTIQEALNEINPIIFSEYTGEWYRGRKAFGKNVATYLAGYHFKSVCEAVYLTTCRKKELTSQQIIKIARSSMRDWETVENYVNSRLSIIPEEDERITPIEDIGIEDIRRAREQTQNRPNNRNRIPEATFHNSFTEELNRLEESENITIDEGNNNQLGTFYTTHNPTETNHITNQIQETYETPERIRETRERGRTYTMINPNLQNLIIDEARRRLREPPTATPPTEENRYTRIFSPLEPE